MDCRDSERLDRAGEGRRRRRPPGGDQDPARGQPPGQRDRQPRGRPRRARRRARERGPLRPRLDLRCLRQPPRPALHRGRHLRQRARAPSRAGRTASASSPTSTWPSGYNEEHGLPVTMLRFFGSYGERQYLNWWGGPQGVFLEAISKGKPMTLHGDGSQTRCFTHIDDMTEATARAIERPEVERRDHQHRQRRVGLDHGARRADARGLGRRRRAEDRDDPLRRGGRRASTRTCKDRKPDLTKQRELLGFTPQVDLEEGVRRLWEWYRGLDRSEAAAAGA